MQGLTKPQPPVSPQIFMVPKTGNKNHTCPSVREEKVWEFRGKELLEAMAMIKRGRVMRSHTEGNT